MTDRELLQQTLDAYCALRDWIKAVPSDTVLPAMPGVDGDWLDEVEETIRAKLAKPETEKHSVWPIKPLRQVQVNVEGTSQMAEPERAYFDAWSMQQLENTLKLERKHTLQRLGRMSWNYEQNVMRADENGPFVCFADVVSMLGEEVEIPNKLVR